MKLNLGAGNDYMEGWCNADNGNCRKDLHLEMSEFPWPISDNKVEQVLAKHVLEHMPKDRFIEVMRELFRVSQNDCIIHVEVPAGWSKNFLTDLTHHIPFTERTFDYFDKTKPLYENGVIYGWKDIDLTVLSAVEIPNPPNGPDLRFVLRVNK